MKLPYASSNAATSACLYFMFPNPSTGLGTSILLTSLSAQPANRIIIRKCKKSMFQINKWWKIAINRPDLFSDKPSKERSNYKQFKDHRHDQSIFSLIGKKFSWKE